MANVLGAKHLSLNDLEFIRQSASDRGDWETSRLANEAMWSPSLHKRAAAKKKLAGMVAA